MVNQVDSATCFLYMFIRSLLFPQNPKLTTTTTMSDGRVDDDGTNMGAKSAATAAADDTTTVGQNHYNDDATAMDTKGYGEQEQQPLTLFKRKQEDKVLVPEPVESVSLFDQWIKEAEGGGGDQSIIWSNQIKNSILAAKK